MGMEMRQELKLSQQLVMTPQLQQAIRLLQLSRMELADLVHEELALHGDQGGVGVGGRRKIGRPWRV